MPEAVLGLRRGDIVEVRNPSEILSMLDEHGALDGLPFMPEMLRFCGQRFRVEKRAEKVCDMLYPLASRRAPNTVLLEDLRCDGSGHDGCQAECRLLWREAWLRRVNPGEPATALTAADIPAALTELLACNAREPAEIDGRPTSIYRCQATEMYRATHDLGRWDPRPLLREYLCGNVGFWRFVKVSARAFVQEPLRALGLRRKIPLRGRGPTSARLAPLGLQAGEEVQVKSRGEIAATLNEKGFNRGLWFDEEMLPHCGKTFRVRHRISRCIDEHTGKMVELRSGDCVTLDGVMCSGEHSPVRWFCPRASYPFWREGWLRRTQSVPTQADVQPAASDPTVDQEPQVEAVFHHPIPPEQDPGG
jgi:hypothetical protein